MQNNSKGFIQIPILIAIIAGILVLGGGGYFGIKQYQSFQTEKINKEQELKKAQDLLAVQQKTAEEEKNNIEKQKQKEQDKQKLEMEKLKNEVEVLKNKPSQTIIKEIPAQKTENDLASIIIQWRPIVAYIKCEFRYPSNILYETASGSGILTLFSDGTIAVITNKHVLIDSKYNGGPTTCDISLPNTKNIYIIVNTNKSDSEGYNPIEVNPRGYDVGFLYIDNPDSYIKSISSSGFKECGSKASVGDEVVILGYPGIGSQTDITATRGIISGYDGDYYITDAKVEHGNSGGMAILVKNNCYLGIPSFATIGSVESLARILDNKIVFPD